MSKWSAYPLRRICCRVSYDGTDYHGWQVQPNLSNTIQGVLQDTLSQFLEEVIQVDGASRTDAGVHAQDQLVAFTSQHPIRLEGLIKGVNRRLPSSIAMREPVEVPLDFQPRFVNQGKIYRYQILSRSTPDPLKERYTYRVPYPLDPERICKALEVWVGTHDFKSFAATDGQHQHSIRTIWHASLQHPTPEIFELRFGGNGFMKQMVRNLVGTAIEVGRGRWTADQVKDILDARDRTQAGPTAPAKGLILEHMLWFPPSDK